MIISAYIIHVYVISQTSRIIIYEKTKLSKRIMKKTQTDYESFQYRSADFAYPVLFFFCSVSKRVPKSIDFFILFAMFTIGSNSIFLILH